MPLAGVLDAIERVCDSLATPVTLLRAGAAGFDVPGSRTRVVGATLWTHLPPGMAAVAPQMLNDFRYIKTGPARDLAVEDVNAMHAADKAWLARAIGAAHADGRAAAVVTHHAPDAALAVNNASHAADGMGVFYYCSDMAGVMRLPGIAVWMYGHCHESGVMRLRGLDYPFVTNALGYPDERTGYAEGARIEVP
jgi:hypothetical protein